MTEGEEGFLAMPPLRLVTLAALGLSCVRPGQEAPEAALRRHVARTSSVPEAAIAAECDNRGIGFHGAYEHSCRAEVNGVAGLYACDCPVATRSVWPVDHPEEPPWRRPRPCSCWQFCCVEREEFCLEVF